MGNEDRAWEGPRNEAGHGRGLGMRMGMGGAWE